MDIEEMYRQVQEKEAVARWGEMYVWALLWWIYGV